MRMLSLCSGIGGIDLAWTWLGQEIAGQVEIDDYCRAVLAKHWPDVPRVEDLRDVRGDEFGPVDLVAGGIPCQGNSVAGKRRGRADERYLWPETARLVRTARPAWVLVENVAGMRSVDGGALFGDVVRDLAQMGYRVGWISLEAADVGAPHRRERVFLLAHADERRRDRLTIIEGQGTSQRGRIGVGGEDVADANRDGLSRSPQHDGGAISREHAPHRNNAQRRDTHDVAHPTRGARQRQASRHTRHAALGDQDMADASISGWEPRQRHVQAGQPNPEGCGNGQTQSRLGRIPDGLPGWLDIPGWPAGPSEPQHAWEAPRTITGTVPQRAARLKALGNAVVPQQVYPILRAIVDAEHEEAR